MCAILSKNAFRGPFAAAVLTILIWGGSPAATQIAVDSIDPLTVGMLRTMLSAVVLLPVALALRLTRPPDWAGWRLLLTSSLSGFVGFTLLFSAGVKLTSTSHAALILVISPVTTGLIGFSVEKSWPRPLWWVGAAVALLGEIILVSGRFEEAGAGGATVQGDLLVFASVFAVSTGYVSGGRLSVRIGSWATTAWGVSLGGLLMLPVLLLRVGGDTSLVSGGTAASWGGVLYLGLFASLVAWAAWFWALGQAGVGRIAPMQFAQPIVSLILAVFLFSEPLTPPVIVAAGTILVGVFLTRRAAGRGNGE